MNPADLLAEDSPFTPYHKGHTSRDAAHLPFVAWDGEGITPPGQAQQDYVLLGNSLGYSIKADRLSTASCLDIIMQTARENPRGIHVGFSFSYDVEMILADVPVKTMQILYKKGYMKWAGHRIEYKKGKWFQVTREYRNEERYTCRIWDVFAFFYTSFLKAVQEYLPDEDTTSLEMGKSSRGDFLYADLDTFIVPYWQLELRLLVRLMETLRERLYGAGLKIRQWHGPGAISSYALRQHNIKRAMTPVPDDVSMASQYAYAGGRFELFQIGQSAGDVYAYDIRSAYPAGIAQLPSLTTGEWHYVERPQTVSRFGVYRIAYANRHVDTVRPHPFFYRSIRHTISFPNIVRGWYWSPEAELALSLPDSHLLEGWVFVEDGSRPFEWVNDVYDRRAQWKRDRNPSQIALKLLLNSMYGKMAQRVGWERTGGAPTWHQLEWAGWVTSYARARLFRAMIEAHRLNALIGVETDGIFTRLPLPNLTIGEGLGEWEMEHYERMIYLQSGFYHKRQKGKWSSKYRGFDNGSVTVDSTLRELDRWKPWENKGIVAGTTTRFPTMGGWLCSTNPAASRRVWTTTERVLSLGEDGKRRHVADHCRACTARLSPADAMHDLVVSEPLGGDSVPHHLPWVATSTPNHYRDEIERDDHA